MIFWVWPTWVIWLDLTPRLDLTRVRSRLPDLTHIRSRYVISENNVLLLLCRSYLVICNLTGKLDIITFKKFCSPPPPLQSFSIVEICPLAEIHTKQGSLLVRHLNIVHCRPPPIKSYLGYLNGNVSTFLQIKASSKIFDDFLWHVSGSVHILIRVKHSRYLVGIFSRSSS